MHPLVRYHYTAVIFDINNIQHWALVNLRHPRKAINQKMLWVCLPSTHLYYTLFIARISISAKWPFDNNDGIRKHFCAAAIHA
jgi:hypothetical protein